MLGFGDYPFAEMLLPSLSTLKPPALEMGVLAATRVLESLGVLPVDDEVQRLNLLDCRLMERESARALFAAHGQFGYGARLPTRMFP